MRRATHLILFICILLPAAFPAPAAVHSTAGQTQAGLHSLADNQDGLSNPSVTEQPTPTPADPQPVDGGGAQPARAQNPRWVEPSWLLSGNLTPDAVQSFSASSSSSPDRAPAGPDGTPGDWDNGWAWACITPLGIVVNAAFGAGLVAPPPTDFFAALAEYSANLGLKLCAPVVYPPSNFTVLSNKAEGTCGYAFSQDRVQGQYQNFYGITLPWGDIFPGKNWGDFGTPLVIHWNTDVDVSLKDPGWTNIIDFPVGGPDSATLERWLPTGLHSLVWRGDTLVNALDFIFIYIPGGNLAKLAKLRKLKKYEKALKAGDKLLDPALDVGQVLLNLFGSDLFPSWRSGAFNEETQVVAITDLQAPQLSTSQPNTTVEALDPGGISQQKYLSLLRRTLTVSDNCDPSPDVVAQAGPDLPNFAALGGTYTIHWVASDNGPRDLNGGKNTTTIDQTFTVADTLPPVILAPPDIVTETVSLPAAIDPGFPATFDLADLQPTIDNNACSQPGVVCAGNEIRFPAGKTTITWSATDEAGNTATATQLVNVKSLGTNHAPTANSQSSGLQAISFEPVTITLTAQDGDGDPLWFKIDQQPQNGFFHSPLYPYFIQDYRLANFQNISFRDYCDQLGHSGYVPTNWPVDADFMAVADDGTVYVHDHGMVFCGGTGDVHEDYRLAVFRPDGTWEQKADSFDTKDIYVDWRNGYIYTTSHNIGGTFDWLRRYDLDLNLVDQFRIDYADIVLRESTQGVMDDQGLIYVSNGFQDSGTAQLYVYDTTQGENLVRVADYSSSDKVFVDLALDSKNNLYASERNMSRVYKFSPAVRNPDGSVTPGTLIGWLGKCDSGPGCDIAHQRSFGFSCREATCTLNTSSSGSLPGQFDSPRGIALDPNDILYVTDHNNLRVQRFTPEGYFAGLARSKCDGSCFVLGDFGSPKQVTVNSSHFYVLDDTADLLHVFETTPLTRVDGHTATIEYQSENNFVGVDNFTFEVSDGLAHSAPAQIDVAVSRNYRPPVANPLPPLTTLEDTSVSLGASGYDPDQPLDTISFQAGDPPEYGSLGGDPANPEYIPNPDFAGQDHFTLVASDGTMLSAPQPVTVTVTPVNDPPTFPEESDMPVGAAFRLAGDYVDLSRLAPLGTADQPMRLGRGFSTAFAVNFFDPDEQDTHMVTVDWGDGSPVETEVPPNPDGSQDGPLLTESKGGGGGTASAEHTFDTTGSYNLSFCVTDNVTVDSNGYKHPTADSATACKFIPVDVIAAADILVQVNGPQNPSAAGQDMLYQLSLTNHMPDSGSGVSASGLVFTATLDARLGAVSADPSQGTCNLDQRQVICDLGGLAPGDSTSIQIATSGGTALLPGATLAFQGEYRLNEPDQSDVQGSLELTTLVAPADFIVNTNEDLPDSSPADGSCQDQNGLCSLRAAVEEANAMPGKQTISLADSQLILASSLVVQDDLTITGLGAGSTVLSGNGSDRLVDVENGANLELNGLALQGGYTSGDGGALLVASGQASLANVQVSGSSADGSGGGIWNAGQLSLQNSAVTGNSATAGAGGIANQGTLDLENVTISGNQGQAGGGIQSSGPASLANVTVANNWAQADGGGLSGEAAIFSLKNTILADNRAQGSGPDCAGGFTSLGDNLTGDPSGCNISGSPGGDLTGLDARLGPLDSNGGGTLTHALRSTSPAIDAGTCDLGADQRGVARPQDGKLDGSPACDIGAYELAPQAIYLPLVRR
jgi:CSLREA domain-containing protein